MKVLKGNYNNIEKTIYYYDDTPQTKPYPRELICDNCDSELEYEESDMRMGAFGIMHLKCPCCGYNNLLEDNEKNITLTVDNIEYPTHFWHTSVETGAVDCCDNEYIREVLKRGIEYLRTHKSSHDYYYQAGNLFVYIYKHEGEAEYSIIISNDFYEMEIPFKDEDY